MSTSQIVTREFILAFAANFAYSSAYFILIPTLPVFLSRLKTGDSEIGILIGVFSVSALLFRPLVGKGLLRTPERTFMLAGALLSLLSSLAYLVASPFWPFFLVRVIQGVSLAFFFTSSATFIANISPERHRGQSLSYFFLANNISFALVPSFGMVLINRFSFSLLFLFCAFASLVSLYLTTRLDKKAVAPPNDSTGQGEGFFSRQALPPSIMIFFICMIWGSLTAFFPLYAIDQGIANPGFFFALFALTLILCRTLGSKWLDVYSREKVLFPCLVNYILATVLLAFTRTPAMFGLAAVFWGSGTAFAYPMLLALALDHAGPARGPAMGTFTAFSDLGVGLGAIIMGMVLSVANYRTMFLSLSLIGLINLSYFALFVRKETLIRKN